MMIKPFNDQVLVQRTEEETKTKGGIIIPDTAKEKPMQGKVVAAGPGKTNKKGKRVPLSVQVGDKVLFSKWAGTEVKMDGVEYVFMKENEIMAVIE